MKIYFIILGFVTSLISHADLNKDVFDKYFKNISETNPTITIVGHDAVDPDKSVCSVVFQGYSDGRTLGYIYGEDLESVAPGLSYEKDFSVKKNEQALIASASKKEPSMIDAIGAWLGIGTVTYSLELEVKLNEEKEVVRVIYRDLSGETPEIISDCLIDNNEN